MSTDALGHPILIGALYGQASKASGSCVVVIGKAIEVENGNVKLENIHRGRASFNDNIHLTETKRKIITVSSNSIFPINGNIGWIEKVDI